MRADEAAVHLCSPKPNNSYAWASVVKGKENDPETDLNAVLALEPKLYLDISRHKRR